MGPEFLIVLKIVPTNRYTLYECSEMAHFNHNSVEKHSSADISDFI